MKKFMVVVPPPKEEIVYGTFEVRNITKEVGGFNRVVQERVEIDPLKVNEGLSFDDFSFRKLAAQGSSELLQDNSIIRQTNLQVADTINSL